MYLFIIEPLKLNVMRKCFIQKFLIIFISAVFYPKFMQDPLRMTSPGQISAQKNHLALNTELQRSSITEQKVETEIFSKNFLTSGLPKSRNSHTNRSKWMHAESTRINEKKNSVA